MATQPGKVVLYAPQLEEMGKGLAAALGAAAAYCTAEVSSSSPGNKRAYDEADTVVGWEQFPGASSEKDPNTKVRIQSIINRHVILLLSQDDTSSAFAQLSLLLWLQRFYVPKPLDVHAKRKWKSTIAVADYDMCSVASLTVVIPWYRYCQMDRSCRWTLTADGKWDNSIADGPFVDVATAHMFAALLSADPPPPPGEMDVPTPPLPPKELLLIDMHDDLNGVPLIESTLRKTGKWANPSIPYNLDTGAGTYFASAFEYFLRTTYKAKATNLAKTAIVFPDKGAYARFHTMVERTLSGIAKENVLFIEKKRVGTEIEQSTLLSYMTADGTQATRDSLESGTAVLIPDDFTNSGSTLFGGAQIVRSKISGESSVAAFVTHFLAKYEMDVVNKFVERLYSEGTTSSELNTFYTTDSIPISVRQLVKEADRRVASGAPQRVFVTPLAPVISDWIANRSASASGALSASPVSLS